MSKFIDMIKDAALSGVAQGIRSTQFNNILGLNGSNNSFDGVDYQTNATDNYPYSDTLNTTTAMQDNIINSTNLYNRQSKFGGTIKYAGGNTEYTNQQYTDRFNITIPSWGYADYINERNVWLKHLSNGLDEQNWLYFRVFFNFDTDHGLLGGILNTEGMFAVNSAYKYLSNLNQDIYKIENIESRKKSLEIFVRTLSTINTLSPWVFKSVSNVGSVANPVIDEFSKEKSINLDLNPDTIDFRITSMLSAYKYACYDDFMSKEIIPENLRKFDMTVVIFSLPIKYIHTPVINDSTGKVLRKEYKKAFDSSNMANIMSMKVLSFYNCEFDKSTLGSYIPGSLTNDSPFQLGKNSLKITYDRVFETTINEYDQILINSMGIWEYDAKDKSTLNLLVKTRDEMSRGDVLLTASDAYITYKLNETFGTAKNFVLGNIYGQDARVYKTSFGKTYSKDSKSSLTDYFSAKVRALKGEKNIVLDVGYNILYKLLGMSYRYGEAPGNDGTGTVLNGQGQLGVGSSVFDEKLARIKYGGFTRDLSARENRLNAINRANNFSLGKYIQNQINRK